MAHCDQSEDNDSHLLFIGRRPKEYMFKTFSLAITLTFFSNAKFDSEDIDMDNPYFCFRKDLMDNFGELVVSGLIYGPCHSVSKVVFKVWDAISNFFYWSSISSVLLQNISRRPMMSSLM